MELKSLGTGSRTCSELPRPLGGLRSVPTEKASTKPRGPTWPGLGGARCVLGGKRESSILRLSIILNGVDESTEVGPAAPTSGTGDSMTDTGQRTADFLAVCIENAELRQTLAEVQDQCVELAVDAGELHAEIEALRAQLSQVEQDRDAWRAEAERRMTG